MLDDRVISDFADRLVPEAFARRHTAYRVDVVDVRPAGRPAFDGWVDARVTEALTDRYAWGGRPVRYVVVEAADGTRWRWDGEPCCLPSWLVDRVRREAHVLAEPWVFAVELPWPEPVWEGYDPELGEVVELDEPIVDPLWTATWYAEARGRGVAAVRAGEVDLDGDEPLRTHEVSARVGLPRVFHRVLYRHPSRKAHRLR